MMCACVGVVADDAVAHALGEVGIAVVRLLLLHLQDGLCEQVLVVGDDGCRLAHGFGDDALDHVVHVLVEVHGGVAVEIGLIGFLVGHGLLQGVLVVHTGAHLGVCQGIESVVAGELAAGKDLADIGTVVIVVFLAYVAVEAGQIFAADLCGVVLKQCGHGLLVHARVVVFIAVADVVVEGLPCVADSVVVAAGHACEVDDLDAAIEGLVHEANGMAGIAAGDVALLQGGEHRVEACLQLRLCTVPAADVLLALLLLLDDAEALDSLVHALRVLPIVR